jgi:hypothetical protein
MQPQSTQTLLMVAPTDFGFNAQTAIDNEFQHQAHLSEIEIQQRAKKEFDNSVQILTESGVNVIVLLPNGLAEKTPDAVFPNNWISTDTKGNIFIFQMATPNRQAETLRYNQVENLLNKQFAIHQVHYLNENAKGILEGTGSMVIDHEQQIIYAASSVRTENAALQHFLQLSNYKKVVTFETKSSNNKPFYHTNVVMSIGTKFAVICSKAIIEKDRERVMSQLKATHQIVDISLEQAEKYFCANVLEVKNKQDETLIVMSETALNGFNENQKKTLRTFGKLVALPIPTIEYVGGGSARCMLAEIFLPKI